MRIKKIEVIIFAMSSVFIALARKNALYDAIYNRLGSAFAEFELLPLHFKYSLKE